MKLEEALTGLGLDHKEIRLYLSALELGEALVSPLASQAGLTRSSVYELLPKLHAAGLVAYGRKGKRRTVIAQDPNALLALQQARLNDIKAVMPELMARFSYKATGAKVRAYEGVEGVKQVYEDTLTDEMPILSFLQVQQMDREILGYLLDSYVPRRIKRGIRVKNLVSGTERQAQESLSDKGTLRENRYVAAKEYPARIEMLIYGDKVAFITYHPDSQPTGIVIESGEIAITLRSLHRLGWNSCASEAN